MSTINDKKETMKLEINVSLKDVQDYESQIGKKISEMSFEEQSILLQRALQSNQTEVANDRRYIDNHPKNSFRITKSFITSDPEIENKRRRSYQIRRQILRGIGALLGYGGSVALAYLNNAELAATLFQGMLGIIGTANVISIGTHSEYWPDSEYSGTQYSIPDLEEESKSRGM